MQFMHLDQLALDVYPGQHRQHLGGHESAPVAQVERPVHLRVWGMDHSSSYCIASAEFKCVIPVPVMEFVCVIFCAYLSVCALSDQLAHLVLQPFRSDDVGTGLGMRL